MAVPAPAIAVSPANHALFYVPQQLEHLDPIISQLFDVLGCINVYNSTGHTFLLTIRVHNSVRYKSGLQTIS